MHSEKKNPDGAHLIWDPMSKTAVKHFKSGLKLGWRISAVVTGLEWSLASLPSSSSVLGKTWRWTQNQCVIVSSPTKAHHTPINQPSVYHPCFHPQTSSIHSTIHPSIHQCHPFIPPSIHPSSHIYCTPDLNAVRHLVICQSIIRLSLTTHWSIHLPQQLNIIHQLIIHPSYTH